MSSTPKPPKAEEHAQSPEAAERVNLDHTILGVGTAPRPLADAAPPARGGAPGTRRSGVVAAPVIPVAGSAGTRPGTAAAPRASERQDSKATPPANAEHTAMYGTPRAGEAPSTRPPGAVMRSPFPKPAPYAIPPRAGEASRAFAGGDRTALSADYLRAAREAAFGKSAATSPSSQRPSSAGDRDSRPPHAGVHTAPAFTRSGTSSEPSKAPFAPPAPATQPSLNAQAPIAPSGSPALSAGSQSRPPAATEPRRGASAGTMLEAAREGAPVDPLPPLPPVSAGPDFADDLPAAPKASPAGGFEPVAAARTQLSDSGAGPGQALGSIAEDLGVDIAESARTRGERSGSQRRWSPAAVVALAALVLALIALVALGKPLLQWIAGSEKPPIEAPRTPPGGEAPERATLANRPAQAPAIAPEAAPSAPATESSAPPQAP